MVSSEGTGDMELSTVDADISLRLCSCVVGDVDEEGGLPPGVRTSPNKKDLCTVSKTFNTVAEGSGGPADFLIAGAILSKTEWSDSDSLPTSLPASACRSGHEPARE